ncbi:MAG TPA: GH1 family beta-glucosidase [Candidatus Bathyarchaeia archaeon]|nr:GH1 family beta-glucosidase [Candidatus Bathyarchaeia archaeon]
MRTPTEKITFPDGFLWGVASSSYQIEGAWNEDGKGESIWDRFSHTPGNIKNGDTGDIACDHYHLYKKDVALMRELGVQAYWFSISWPRVLPKGKGDINRVGLEFYNRLVDELLEAGIEPWICLYHWDLPQALQDEGGWANPNIIQYFANYAELMARELGDRVKRWMIFNEPQCVAWLGHFTGMHAPGIKNLESALKVSHHLLLTQGKTIQTLRKVSQDFQIGTIVDLNVVHPISDDEKDQEAASKLDEFRNRWFIDPLLKGEYPPLAKEAGLEPKREDMDLIKQPLDFLGVNYYRRSLAAYDPSDPLMRAKVVQKKTPVTEMGWEIYPNGLYEILTRLRKEYDDPVLYVTENGAAFEDNVKRNGGVQDDDRIAFLRDHMLAAYRAIKEGVKLKGYFIWTITDNFEWAEGYSKRFGLVHTNYETRERAPKKSFYWYKQIIQNNGLLFP